MAAIGAVAALFAVEAVNWQHVFAHDGPDRGFVFEADVRPIVEAALAHGGTVYARRDNHTAYIDTLFDAVVAGRKPKSIVILEPGVSPPPGVVFVGGPGIARAAASCAGPQLRRVRHALLNAAGSAGSPRRTWTRRPDDLSSSPRPCSAPCAGCAR